MSLSLTNYLRTMRRRWALTQDQLADLIGTSASQISCIERSVRPPNLRTMLCYQVVFGIEPRKLLPKHFDEVEETVMQEAARLYDALQGSPGLDTKRRLTLLEEVLDRATKRSNRTTI